MGAAKRKKLDQSIRERAWENNNGLYVPRVDGDKKLSTWPVCGTCNRDVDRVNIEGYTDSTVDIRVWCHKEECTVRMQFPFGMTSKDDEGAWRMIHQAINNAVWFEKSIA